MAMDSTSPIGAALHFLSDHRGDVVPCVPVAWVVGRHTSLGKKNWCNFVDLIRLDQTVTCCCTYHVIHMEHVSWLHVLEQKENMFFRVFVLPD